MVPFKGPKKSQAPLLGFWIRFLNANPTIHFNEDLQAVLRIQDVYPGSRILIFVHPSSRAGLGSRIQKQQQKRGVKENCCPTFFCSHKNHKIENYINFELAKKNNLDQFTKNCRTFYPKKLSLSSQKYGFGIRDTGSEIRDPRSGIRKKSILDPGSRGPKWHRIPDPQHCLQHCLQYVNPVLIHSIACLLCLYLYFNLQDLDLGGVATAYGLLRLPKMPELKRLQVGLLLFCTAHFENGQGFFLLWILYCSPSFQGTICSLQYVLFETDPHSFLVGGTRIRI
jgi:hypothetical protein